MPFRPTLLSPFIVSTIITLIISQTTVLTIFPLLCWVYVFLVSFYVFYYSWIYPYYISPLRAVPTGPGFPLWSQTFTIVKEEVGVPQRIWHERYGPIIRYFYPLGTERISVADDEALNHMLVKNSYNYLKTKNARI